MAGPSGPVTYSQALGGVDVESGVVTLWKETEGYGFIRADTGGDDVFLHRRALPTGAEVNIGDPVSFVCEMRDRGLYATEARVG